jgi:tripartite-type tricarboxylate transporter receptor subunit TctC
MAMFSAEGKVPLIPVPYKGAAPAILDVLAGNIPITISNIAPVLGYIREGKLKPLMVFQSERNPALPDVPTVREVIGTDVRAPSWFGFFVQSRTPVEIRHRLEEGIRRALAETTVKNKLQAANMDIAADVSTEQFARLIAEERAYNASLVKHFNIKPE